MQKARLATMHGKSRLYDYASIFRYREIFTPPITVARGIG